MTDFQLQFDSSEIDALAAKYAYAEDTSVLEAGRRIRRGEFSRENLLVIYQWKTNGRGMSRLARNSDDEVADALRLAVDAKTERAAISVLVGLCGVEVPVASAILTAIDPERYTIIDFRALDALGQTSKNRSVDYYLLYLAACRKIAMEHGVTLRKLDRALWQWSKENSSSAVLSVPR
jgi:hypothetical protein